MSRSSTVSFAIVSAAGQLIGPSPDRRGLVFSPPTSGSYTVSNASVANLGEGMTIVAGAPPLVFTQEIHGDCVQKAWFVKTSATPMTVGFIEALGS